MIISHKYRFIFLKTAKTAGTSIEIALSRFCGEEDVITPITPQDEETRSRLGYRGPQNYTIPLHKYHPRDWAGLLLGRKRRQFYNHCPAEVVKRFTAKSVWNEYYKFCFERNPWDRVISLYYFVHATEPRPSISAFIDSDRPRVLRSRGFEIYTINGQIVVDRVCPYENLEEELENICNERLGLPAKLTLPRAKGGFRTDRRHYREILSNEDKQKIARMFAEEIALFGYKC